MAAVLASSFFRPSFATQKRSRAREGPPAETAAAAEATSEARGYTANESVLFADLDDFKEVDDSLAYRAGDEPLIGPARAPKRRLRAGVHEAREPLPCLLPRARGRAKISASNEKRSSGEGAK